MHKGLCSFTAAEADLRALLDVRPSHKGAAKELLVVAQGQRDLTKCSAAAAASRCTTDSNTPRIPDLQVLPSVSKREILPVLKPIPQGFA